MTKRSNGAEGTGAPDPAGPPGRRATAVATGGRMMLVETSATSRVFIYMLGKFLQRMEQERRDLYFGDLDLARVMEVVSLASVEPGMRDAAFREKHSSLASIVGIDGQRATNATSIANATGIPRETIRRKLKQLQSLGVIIEKEPARYVVQPGILQQPERQEAFARGIRATVAFMNECLEQGVVRWVPKPVDGGQEG